MNCAREDELLAVLPPDDPVPAAEDPDPPPEEGLPEETPPDAETVAETPLPEAPERAALAPPVAAASADESLASRETVIGTPTALHCEETTWITAEKFN